MEQASAPPEEDSAPATRGDLRWIRRWLAVVGVWAVAASAVAIIALATRQKETSRTSRIEDRVSTLRSDFDQRISDLRNDLNDVPKTQDVANLQSRLQRVEKDSSKASTDASKASGKLKDLENRVKTLESAPKTPAQPNKGK